jgi:hypothetical protein
MPFFTFPLSPDGLAVHGLVGLNGPDTAARLQAGQPIPRPISVRALLDTACDMTTIAPGVFQQLGLVRRGRSSTQTAGGQVPVNLYRVSLSVLGPTGAPSPMLVEPDLRVLDLAAALSNVDALIGLDILNENLLVHNGPARQFILAF